MTVNDITYEIRGAIYDVYKELGPGHTENTDTTENISHRKDLKLMMCLDYFEVLLKVNFQDTSKEYKPLFTTKQS